MLMRKSPEDVTRLTAFFYLQVTWESTQDPQDPYNWPTWRKVSIALVVSLGQLITLMSASMMAAALPQIGHDLHLSDSATQITFSIYILGLAFAPFLIAALSEMYGRRPIWIASNFFYIFWNAFCPVGPSAGLMTVSRFLAGSGASCGITVRGSGRDNPSWPVHSH